MGTADQRSQDQVAWSPQEGPQEALVNCPVFEIFYGGARGGGKTDGMLGKFALEASEYGEHAVGVFFRRTREDLREAIERSQQIYRPIGAQYHEQKKEWSFPTGARLKFQYLDKDRDADNYQGHNYTHLFFEELTHWPDPTPVNKLKATLRSAAGVPCQFHATGNPGGPGHLWVKARYIDPNPNGWEIVWEEFKSPFDGEVRRRDRVFIPAKLTDNQLLLKANPNYTANLQQSGSEQLVRAWLLGDWDVIEGAYFDCWAHDKHVIRPFTIPDHWLRFRSFDWGSAKPFSVGWWAVASEGIRIHQHDRDFSRYIPKGALVRYREWYGCSEPNVGVKMTAEDVALGIKVREEEDSIGYGVADPSIFAEDGGPCFAERMFKAAGIRWKKADNRRVPDKGRLGGWDQMRARMLGDGNHPMIFTFDTCRDSIRTIPALQHDETRPEDVDTDGEDHAGDEWRYACMSRPYTRPTPVAFVPSVTRTPTVMETLERMESKRPSSKRI